MPSEISRKLNSIMANFLCGIRATKENSLGELEVTMLSPESGAVFGNRSFDVRRMKTIILFFRPVIFNRTVLGSGNEFSIPSTKLMQWDCVFGTTSKLKQENEYVAHLLLFCKISWELWMRLASLWRMQLVFPCNLSSFITLLHDSCPVRLKESIWYIIPFAILWSIWILRNEIVFKNGKVDEIQLSFLAKFRLASWFKAKFPKASVSLDNLLLDPSISGIPKLKNYSRQPVLFWHPPPADFLKLNIDGVVKVDGSVGEIGGLIKNHKGETIISFSEPIGPGPSVSRITTRNQIRNYPFSFVEGM
ncbi:hypothetical protein V6N11_001298 [Hibiscus sabdariffa]|uniref:Reverse transcriptase zinc-binding domain-containing protein n=1 Tax=Hibiscus sabdariffa TaxID=183260 RepID=A0ABR2S055_9ROSI